MNSSSPTLRHRLLCGSFILACCISASHIQAAPAKFVHPGLLHSGMDFERMRTKVREGAQPWAAGFERLTRNPHASTGWKPRPVEIVYRGNDGVHGQNYPLIFRDAAAAYANALRWKITGDNRHADKAVEILNAWSGALTKGMGSMQGTSDRFLVAGVQGYQLANAAEIMRTYPGWASKDFERFKKMLLDVFYPWNQRMLTVHNWTRPEHYWANWDLASMASMIAIGVLTDRRDIYDEAVEYFKHGDGNGAVKNAVWYIHPNGLGQWQESGRDQGHSVMGIGLMAAICEMAWNQGDDLYGYDDNRFLKGAEYVAAYNLLKSVPFKPYYNRSHGLQTDVSAVARAQERPVWAAVYNHYVKRMGLKAPNVTEMVAKIGIEGGGGDYGNSSGGYDQLGFGTLTYTVTGPVENGVYGVASLNSGLLMDAAQGEIDNGTSIIQWKFNRGENQKWRFQHLGDDRYRITGVPSGRALDVSDGAVSDGAKVHLWNYFGGKNQIWRVTSVNNRSVRLCPVHAPGSCLAVKDASKANGARVQLWKYAGKSNQQWSLIPR